MYKVVNYINKKIKKNKVTMEVQFLEAATTPGTEEKQRRGWNYSNLQSFEEGASYASVGETANWIQVLLPEGTASAQWRRLSGGDPGDNAQTGVPPGSHEKESRAVPLYLIQPCHVPPASPINKSTTERQHAKHK